MASNSDNLISAKALQEIENPSLFRKLMAIKSLFVAISISTLLASNIASLTSSAAHNWMHSVLWTVLSIGGDLFADKALSNSPKSSIEQKVKAQTTDLEVKNKKLVQQIEANGILAKDAGLVYNEWTPA